MNETQAKFATVVVEHSFSAPPEKVFDAWLDPEIVKLWFHGGNTHVSAAEIDARVGGRIRIVMRDDDRDWEHVGEYLEIDRPNRLVLTWFSPSTDNKESLVTVLFEAKPGGTRIILTHDRLPADMQGGFDKGWRELLVNLAELELK